MPSTRSQTQGHSSIPQPILPKPSSIPKRTATLEDHLTDIVLSMTAAVNARDFNPFSPAWTSTTSDFTSEPSFYLNDNSCGLHDFLRLYDEQTRDHPEYFVRVKGCDVFVNSKKEHAMAFTDVETNGLPPGITRPSVGVVEFVRVEGGEWKCKRYRCMPGLEVLGVVGKAMLEENEDQRQRR